MTMFSMTLRLILFLFTFSLNFAEEISLRCWRCEVTRQAIDDGNDVFLDDCQAEFDFTQHKLEPCDGKCWKSVDLPDGMFNGSSWTGNRFAARLQRNTTILKSSRRCFSADELLRAAELGINTSTGCRQVKHEGRKVKEVCFCSDQDMCNLSYHLSPSIFISILLLIFFLDQIKDFVWSSV